MKILQCQSHQGKYVKNFTLIIVSIFFVCDAKAGKVEDDFLNDQFALFYWNDVLNVMEV